MHRLAPELRRLTAAVAFAVSTPALAGTYAAMKEVPVTGGELRLASTYIAPAATSPDGIGAASIGFPLKHTRVDIDVAGPMAQVVVEQLFTNPYDEPLEAVYLFPLDDEAAVHGYQIVIGDRVIDGVVKERKQARRDYEDAKQAGNTAALLEQQRDNVFEQSIANIAPHEDVLVRLTYVQLVDHDDDGWEISFPMVVGPRFLPPTTTDPNPIGATPAGMPGRPGAKNIEYLPLGMRSGHDIEVVATIDPGVPVVDLACTSHVVELRSVDATTTEVAIAASDSLPNKDFVLRWTTAGISTNVGLLTHRAGQDGYVTLVIQPKAEYRTGDITPREVLVVLDASGSMHGTIALAQAVGKRIVAGVRPEDTVNVFRYADRVKALHREPIAGDEAGVRRAMAYIDAVRPSGGTMMNDAVMRAFGTRPDDGRVRMIYLVTDGYIGNDEEVLDTVGRTTDYNRISTVGIGAAPNRYLLDRMAEIGRGVSVACGLDDAPEAIADEVVRRTAFPYLTDVIVDWGGLHVEDVVPQVIPDVPAGKSLVLSARYQRPGKGTVRVLARSAGRDVEIALPLELPEHDERPGVEMLWVRQQVKALVNASHRPGADPDLIKAEITRLGIEHQIATRFTSFIAVDTSRVVQGDLRTVQQPVEVPEGMTWEGLFRRGGSVAARQASASGGGSSGSRSGGFDLFDDVDPVTIAGVAAFLLVVLVLKRRQIA